MEVEIRKIPAAYDAEIITIEKAVELTGLPANKILPYIRNGYSKSLFDESTCYLTDDIRWIVKNFLDGTFSMSASVEENQSKFPVYFGDSDQPAGNDTVTISRDEYETLRAELENLRGENRELKEAIKALRGTGENVMTVREVVKAGIPLNELIELFTLPFKDENGNTVFDADEVKKFAGIYTDETDINFGIDFSILDGSFGDFLKKFAAQEGGDAGRLALILSALTALPQNLPSFRRVASKSDYELIATLLSIKDVEEVDEEGVVVIFTPALILEFAGKFITEIIMKKFPVFAADVRNCFVEENAAFELSTLTKSDFSRKCRAVYFDTETNTHYYDPGILKYNAEMVKFFITGEVD